MSRLTEEFSKYAKHLGATPINQSIVAGVSSLIKEYISPNEVINYEKVTDFYNASFWIGDARDGVASIDLRTLEYTTKGIKVYYTIVSNTRVVFFTFRKTNAWYSYDFNIDNNCNVRPVVTPVHHTASEIDNAISTVRMLIDRKEDKYKGKRVRYIEPASGVGFFADVCDLSILGDCV